MKHQAGPPRAEHKFTPLDLDAISETGWFSGYASLFGEVDLGRDLVEKGAFAASLKRRGASGIRMLFQHDPAEVIGSWKVIREDARGLYVEGLLSGEVARAREVHALMKSGALDGLSIGFRTVRAEAGGRGGPRRILEADLWEISVVTFPMLPAARIAEVKASEAKGSDAWGQGGAPLLAAIRRATRLVRSAASST